jgi:branched-chain amino acid transport system ATP-binding protein
MTPGASRQATAGAARGALRVRGLVKRFGGVAALDGVDLEVAPGEAVAVIGPNGAGKSTLLKTVAGIHRPDAGTVHLGGTSAAGLSQHRVVRLGVALAHQIPRPFSQLTVADNVRVASMASRGRPAGDQVDEVLDLCGLGAKAHTVAGALRVLDAKRLEVARALATGPEVLMLDEVAAGLVGRELDEVIDLIRRVHAQGRTILLVEHVERVVHEVVSRVLVLDWGKPVASGAPEDVARDPKVRAVYLGSGATSSARRTRATPDAPPHAAPGTGSGTGDGAPAAAVDGTTARTAPVLSVAGLTAGYGQLVALRDVSLEVGPGEVVAVLGANGAGKSTLCGAVAGTVATSAGRIEAFGQDVTGLPAWRRSRLGIAYCQEGRRVFDGLTVAENLALGGGTSLRREQLAERLDHVHGIFPVLAQRSAQRAGSLSGGQQQMLAIGRALMAGPRVVLCDEVSLGLAPIMVDALYEALERIRADGVSIVLVEQNVHRCLDLADRAYVLMRGRLSYTGDPADLLSATRLDEAYFGSTQLDKV